jgi:hypothetical protein
MSEPLDTITEESSQSSSATLTPTHEYLEVIDTVIDAGNESIPVNENDSLLDLEPETQQVDSSEPETQQVDSSEPETQQVDSSEPETPAPTSTVNNTITEIRPASPITTESSQKYDNDLAEYMETTFNTLTSLVNGISVGPENWVLLLTKAMYVVSLIKSLDADKKIRLSVNLVIRYLDDYTTLEDSVLISIKSSVHSMCVAMLNNTGVLTPGTTTKPAIITGDPDVLATPLQITDLVIKKLINLVKSRKLDVAGIKGIFPELVVLCITTVEKYPHFTGLEKKNLVIQIIQRFLTEYVPLAFTVTHDEKQGLNVLSQSLPFLVDTLVNVGRGKVNYKFDFSNPETLSKLKLLGICLLSCIKRRPNTL